MTEKPSLKPIELLRILTRHHVDFIIVGGVCAVLHGSPVTTFDMDIVHSRGPENLLRLTDALKEMDARYRGHPARIEPDADKLASDGHHLLMTRLGPLDVLGTIEGGASYSSLVHDSTTLEVEGMQIRLLNLETLIRLKEKDPRPKDLAVLPILRGTLEEIGKKIQ